MRARRTAIAAGAAVALYLGGALLSGHLSPLARRPLLEGITPPPPYRWVKPPAELAAGNKAPDTAKKDVAFDARGNVAGVFNTADLQISVILEGGAMPQQAGQTKGTLTMEPLDPATLGAVPAGFEAAGNAYRVAATAGSASITTLSSANQIQMVYPAPAPNLLGREHTILQSADGKTWAEMKDTSDQPAGQQVLSTSLRSLGYFVAALKPAATPAKRKTAGSGFLVIIVVVVAAAGITGLMLWSRSSRERKRRREEALRRARKMGKKKGR